MTSKPIATPTPSSRRAMLGAIHIAVKDLALPRDQYEAMVMGVSVNRASSSKDLTEPELGRLLDRLRDLGWVSKPKTPKEPKLGKGAEDGQAAMIRGMWAKLATDPSDGALRKWVEKWTGKSDLRFCTSRDKGKLIEGLKAWAAREAKKSHD